MSYDGDLFASLIYRDNIYALRIVHVALIFVLTPLVLYFKIVRKNGPCIVEWIKCVALSFFVALIHLSKCLTDLPITNLILYICSLFLIINVLNIGVDIIQMTVCIFHIILYSIFKIIITKLSS